MMTLWIIYGVIAFLVFLGSMAVPFFFGDDTKMFKGLGNTPWSQPVDYDDVWILLIVSIAIASFWPIAGIVGIVAGMIYVLGILYGVDK